MGLRVARKNGGLPPTSSGVVEGLAFCDYPKFLSLPYRFIRDRRFHSTIEMIILKLRKSLNRKGSRCIVDILSDESSHFEDALGNQREGASELRRAETWTKNLELISKLRRHDQLVIVINRLFKFLEKLQIALILEEGEEGGKKEIKKILLLLLKAWELLAQRLQQLFLSAWMPEFPNNFRHPCTTMPWTIWPALAVLWGVCWMFYDDGNFWNLINVSETNLQPNTEEDLRQDETVLGRNGSLSGDLHSGPIPINVSPVFDDFSIFDYVPSYVPGETSHRRATNWPHDDLVANDRQPAAIPGNDDIDYPGLIMTIGEHATLSSAVPQTQLNLQAEQQASLMLQPTTGISEGQENSHTAVAGLPFECSVASCDKTFTTKSGLTAHSKRHDKPFICDECPDRFGSKKELDRHQSSKHSLERPFVCSWPQCERSRRGWPRKDNYDRHVRDVHKGQHEPTAPLLTEGDVPSGGPAISRKRQREDSDDSESDLRSELRKRDERIRGLEQELGETRRYLNETRGSLNDTKIVLNEYKELCTHYKEQAKMVQEKGA